MPLSPELEAYLPRFIQIESGGDPNARTGSYSGLLQMGPDEIARYGGNGLEQGKQLLADRAAEISRTLGRDPTPTELYLAHQQGLGGALAHMANPDVPAWQNMAGTAEGRRKGEGWAKQAIWGNVPDSLKAQFPGGVDSLTSQQFMDLWRSKVERTPLNAQATAPPVPVLSQGLPGYGSASNNASAGISGANVSMDTPQNGLLGGGGAAGLLGRHAELADEPMMQPIAMPRRQLKAQRMGGLLSKFG